VANHPSARKRHKQSEKKRLQNRQSRSRVGTLIRKVNTAIGTGDAEAAAKNLGPAIKALAKAAAKGLIHPRNAARRTGRLAHKVAQLQG
jgi:small subunit ribosomal protein S20